MTRFRIEPAKPICDVCGDDGCDYCPDGITPEEYMKRLNEEGYVLTKMQKGEK